MEITTRFTLHSSPNYSLLHDLKHQHFSKNFEQKLFKLYGIEKCGYSHNDVIKL